jgi:hypothetical protein
MTDAARRALLIRDGLAAVAEWEAQYGTLTDAEMAAARDRVKRQLRKRTSSQRRKTA